ncbi:hypothetical protein EJ06DRAFT_478579 [Trichodelitschia bisporula]|uniref:Zn(2)-C6 fungal-type domain-containing protein n=1 Tax=Trichodelitschia bisporula TaxID=703511 RepID=A0A6G1HUV2_9PEZI|nr:hypothetical protein EJ06DRAFT_478579 [Trichodelitschia bisporula]
MSSSTRTSATPPPGGAPAGPGGALATTSTTKRACDNCHRRKIKCTVEPSAPNARCTNCATSGLACTYNAIPQKKGPKGSRAKVLNELRRQNSGDLGPSRASASLSQAPRTPGLLPPDVVRACIDFFFKKLYPMQPVVHFAQIETVAGRMGGSAEAYAEIASLCAFALLYAGMSGMGPTEGLDPARGRALLDEALAVRRAVDGVEAASLGAVYTAYWASCCYLCLDNSTAAWIWLRQATTVAHVLGLHDEATYDDEDYVENSRKRRLYWVMFMTERRTYAIRTHRPLTLYATIRMPVADDDPSETVPLSGFFHVATLFLPLDDKFFSVLHRRTEFPGAAWIVTLQARLADAFHYMDSTHRQVLCLKVTQAWLRVQVWRLALRHDCISPLAPEACLTYGFPVDVARELVEMVNVYLTPQIENMLGLAEKLADVADTLADILALGIVPPFAPASILNSLTSSIASARGPAWSGLARLQSKIAQLPNLRGFPPQAQQVAYSPDTGLTASPPPHPAGLAGYGVPMPGLPYHPFPAQHGQGSFPGAPGVESGGFQTPEGGDFAESSRGQAGQAPGQGGGGYEPPGQGGGGYEHGMFHGR